MPALSLSELCKKSAARNVKSLLDVGDIPYHVLRPILMKIDDAKQLRSLELRSPQIWGPDGEVWAELIKRDVTDWEKRPYETPHPKNWHKLYHKLMDDVAAEVKRDAEELKARLQNLKSAREHSKQVKAAEVPPLPKMGGMKLVRNPRPVKKTANSLPALTFTGHIKTKGLSGGAMFQKIKREVREKSHFGNGSKLAVPTHKLSERASKVLVPPPSIIYDRLHHPRYDEFATSSSSSSSPPPPPPPTPPTRAKPELKPYVFTAQNGKKRTSDEAGLLSLTRTNNNVNYNIVPPPLINSESPPGTTNLPTTPLIIENRLGTISGRRHPKMASAALRRPSNLIKHHHPTSTPIDPYIIPTKRRRLS